MVTQAGLRFRQNNHVRQSEYSTHRTRCWHPRQSLARFWRKRGTKQKKCTQNKTTAIPLGRPRDMLIFSLNCLFDGPLVFEACSCPIASTNTAHTTRLIFPTPGVLLSADLDLYDIRQIHHGSEILWKVESERKQFGTNFKNYKNIPRARPAFTKLKALY
jgi:hypothetical protein